MRFALQPKDGAARTRRRALPHPLSAAIGTVIVVAAALLVMTVGGEAHKPITSKYTYNDDVFPILRNRCASCHVTGGVAPMSLMTYEEAFPWAESIRTELIAGHMPPWHADQAFGELKGAHALTPKELDVILTWASGGNPRGSLDQKLPPVTLKNEWTMGKPDLELSLPAEFTLAADRMEDTQEFTIPLGNREARWIRAADLLPGTPSIVRSAVIYVKGPAASPTDNGGKAEPDHVLARWLPGREPDPVAPGVAFRVPAGADLGVRIHYKKTWQFEGKPMTDRSTVGVYYASAQPAQELLTLAVTSPNAAQSAADQRVTFNETIGDDVQVLALSPDQVPPNITLQVEAVRPDGSRVPLIRLNTRTDWDRRYWFDRPIALPRGSRVEVIANLQDPDLMSGAFGPPTATKPAPTSTAIRLALNVISARATPSAP